MRIRLSHALATAAPALVALFVLWPSEAQLQDEQPTREAIAPIDSVLEQRRASFEGTWRMSQSPREARRVIDAAVERAVAPMSFFIRGIARSRLREGTPMQRQIVLGFEDGDRLHVRFGEGDGYTTRIGRTEVRTNPEGQRMRVTQRFRPSGQLEQVFETDQGTRWYVYTPTAEGRLHLETTTGSPRMPQPMYYQLDYERVRD